MTALADRDLNSFTLWKPVGSFLPFQWHILVASGSFWQVILAVVVTVKTERPDAKHRKDIERKTKAESTGLLTEAA